MHFAKSIKVNQKATANTKLEFVTLRIFPFRKHTSAFLHELRALPPMKLRLANIELPKTEQWAERQRAKGVFKRMYDVINEPRFKFYIKEGRLYTMKTGVPGVWEEVAARIQDQTVAEEEYKRREIQGVKPPITAQKPAKLVRPVIRPVIKRQTSRPIREQSR